MPDSDGFISDTEETNELTFTVACECYCNPGLIEEALAQLPNFNGSIVWGAPITPPFTVMREDDLVVVVSDKVNLPLAIDRSSSYQQQERAVILILLQDDEDVTLAEETPGLTLSWPDLVAGLSSLTQALFAPVFPQGLVGIDWADTRHVLAMNGQVMLEEVAGSQPTDLIKVAITRLRERASGRSIQGIQASLWCSPDKLVMRHVHDLLLACKEATNEEAILIMGASVIDSPSSGCCEVRLMAKVECAGQREKI